MGYGIGQCYGLRGICRSESEIDILMTFSTLKKVTQYCKTNHIPTKVYAVREGRAPGLYASWDDCKMQIHGYKGAQYKSFKYICDAKLYMERSAPSVPTAGLHVYTDGSCLDQMKKKHVGYACYFGVDDPRNYIGTLEKGTNNVGELLAVYEALNRSKGDISIYTDSQYVITCIDKIKDCIKQNTVLPANMINREHIDKIRQVMATREGLVTMVKVEAHCGIENNEIVDKMAREGAMKSFNTE